jgi:uncharacterized membrane protein
MKRPTSLAPMLLACGAMLILWGVTSTWIISVAGLIVVVIGSARWIKEVRHEN